MGGDAFAARFVYKGKGGTRRGEMGKWETGKGKAGDLRVEGMKCQVIK
jgi:hypothetical protein